MQPMMTVLQIIIVLGESGQYSLENKFVFHC